MKGIISRLRESGTLTFWLVIVFLIMAGGIASIALHQSLYHSMCHPFNFFLFLRRAEGPILGKGKLQT